MALIVRIERWVFGFLHWLWMMFGSEILLGNYDRFISRKFRWSVSEQLAASYLLFQRLLWLNLLCKVRLVMLLICLLDKLIELILLLFTVVTELSGILILLFRFRPFLNCRLIVRVIVLILQIEKLLFLLLDLPVLLKNDFSCQFVPIHELFFL